MPVMKIVMKNYFALVVLMAVAGGNIVCGMKYKGVSCGIEQQSKEKINTSQNKINFMEKYAPPIEIVKCIEESISAEENIFYAKYCTGVKVLYGLCYKGPTVDRVINAIRLRNYIQEKKFNKNFDVATKYVYEIDGEIHVFAKKIMYSLIKSLTSEEVKQLATLIVDTGFTDFGGDWCSNIVRDDDTGKIIFIDTENKTFEPLYNKRYLINRFILNLGMRMKKEDLTWLKKYAKTLGNVNDAASSVSVIVASSMYDDKDIIFKKVNN